jgi:hypothetical protein
MQNEIEIMHILRVPPMGKLVVSFNNQRYESISQVPDAKVQQLMLAAIGELITFAGGYQKLVDAGVAPPISPSQAVPTPAPPPAEESDEATSFVSRMEQERDEIKSAKAKPTISLLANLRPRPARNEASANKMLNLVEQVDAILQRHLKSEPDLAERKIHLIQDSGGGLLIEVDGKQYQRPRDIDDARIQEMIKRALKEWEST